MIREDVNIFIFSIDYHCYPVIRFETNFLETFKQLAKSKDSPSQHAHHIFFTQGHKLYYFNSFYQPSDLLIAQVVNLPRVRSAVPSVGTLSKAVPLYGSFSFPEATGVELWGASIFTVRQRLPEDRQSSAFSYLIILNFSFQETPSERPSADGAPHYDFEQGKARALSEFTEVSGEGAGKFNAEFKSFRLSCRYDFECGQALNLLAIADAWEPSHARTMQNLVLKLLAFAVVIEHGLACKLHSFAVVVEDEPFISKTDLIREATIAEEHAMSNSCSRTTRGSHAKLAAAISDLEAILQLFQAASSLQSENLSAAKFTLDFNFVVLTHSLHFSLQ